MKNFWNELPSPFLILAPMENVTDIVFRQVVVKAAKPDVFFTEFTNTDAICSKGFKRVKHQLEFKKNEHPIVGQIWGNTPAHYFESAKILADMDFDGIDINFGCPVVKGSCAGLIGNTELVTEIIEQTKKGAPNVPISVKTRLGKSKIEMDWIEFILKQNISALTIHLRTASEMSKVPAHWDMMEKIVTLRDAINPATKVIGNGDVLSKIEALEKAKLYGCDGIMIGRGIFHNLWVFSDRDEPTISIDEKITMLLYHIALFEKTWEGKRPFEVLKKFYKIYITGFPNANDVRLQMMRLTTLKETTDFLENLKKELAA